MANGAGPSSIYRRLCWVGDCGDRSLDFVPRCVVGGFSAYFRMALWGGLVTKHCGSLWDGHDYFGASRARLWRRDRDDFSAAFGGRRDARTALAHGSGVGAGIILIGFSVATSTGQRFIQAKRWDLLILILAGVVLPPLVYFIVYFCALHSPMHVGHSLGEIGDADRRPAVVWAIGLTIVTLMLAAVGYAVLMPFVSADAGLLQVVFVGLAALTVPHLALIDGAQPKPGAPN